MYKDNSYRCKAIGRTFSPLALFMALSGRNTLRTLRIFTTEMADDLQDTSVRVTKKHTKTDAMLSFAGKLLN